MTSKIAAMKAGYSAFVKKGTSTTANVFKPSVTSKMTEEENLFDNLLRETKTKQNVVSTSDDPVEMSDDSSVLPPIIGPTVPLIPLVQPPPPPDDDAEAPELQNGTPLASWDTPAPSSTKPATQDYSGLKQLPADRTMAILEKEREESLSEGECSDSEDEKMES